jgi:nitrogen fixation-related uncharacterized protein
MTASGDIFLSGMRTPLSLEICRLRRSVHVCSAGSGFPLGIQTKIPERGVTMLTVVAIFAVVIIVGLASYNAYLLWYAKSGRYDLDRRIDAATKQ